MLKVALVGNIASGKSTVQKYLEKFGYSVLDTDKVCHNILETSTQIPLLFKYYDVLDSGKISREKLGKLVFNNQGLKKKLESCIYPQLVNEMNRYFEQKKEEDIVFVAIPLLFENNMEDIFDKIVFVYCDDDTRLERLIKRNNYTLEYTKKRMDAQLSQDIKVQKSDLVIKNNDDLKTLETQVIRVVEQLKKLNRI